MTVPMVTRLRARMLHCLVLGVALCGMWLSEPAFAYSIDDPPAVGDRSNTLVARTERFEIHSDFWANLHDFLYERSQPEEPPTEIDPRLDALPDEHARGWRDAEAFYREHMRSRNHLRDELMTHIRYRCAGLEFEATPHEMLDDVLAVLERAAPAYRALWWEEHDRRNRAWYKRIAPLVTELEPALAKRLAREYQYDWPESRIVVDLVGYVSWAGADTVVRPYHIMIGTQADELDTPHAAFETLFHEASHTLVGGRTGPVASHLREACGARGVPMPRDLWHAILFYSTGEAVREALADAGHDDAYVPYAYARGLFTRGDWPSYRAPLEQHWRSYLDGETDMKTAIDRIIADLNRDDERK